MLTGLILAVWIGIEGLGITAEQSYDYGFADDCTVQVVCGGGVEVAQYSYDITDLGPDFQIGPKLYGLSAYSGQLTWDGSALTYLTGTGQGHLPEYSWTALDPGHFLFLQSVTGELYVAIEDLPAFLPGWGPTDLDYNDALYRIDPLTTVPEPGTLLLLGTGLAVAARYRKRRAQ